MGSWVVVTLNEELNNERLYLWASASQGNGFSAGCSILYDSVITSSNFSEQWFSGCCHKDNDQFLLDKPVFITMIFPWMCWRTRANCMVRLLNVSTNETSWYDSESFFGSFPSSPSYCFDQKEQFTHQNQTRKDQKTLCKCKWSSIEE